MNMYIYVAYRILWQKNLKIFSFLCFAQKYPVFSINFIQQRVQFSVSLDLKDCRTRYIDTCSFPKLFPVHALHHHIQYNQFRQFVSLFHLYIQCLCLSHYIPKLPKWSSDFWEKNEKYHGFTLTKGRVLYIDISRFSEPEGAATNEVGTTLTGCWWKCYNACFECEKE